MHARNLFLSPQRFAWKKWTPLLIGACFGVLLTFFLYLLQRFNIADSAYWRQYPESSDGIAGEGFFYWCLLVFPFVCLLGFLLAGVVSARTTRRVVDGTWAGLWAGGLGGLFAMLVSLRLQALFRVSPSDLLVPGWETFSHLGLVGTILLWSGLVVVTSLIGCGMGAIGGVIHKHIDKA